MTGNKIHNIANPAWEFADYKAVRSSRKVSARSRRAITKATRAYIKAETRKAIAF